jgi:hypothetical protein
MRSNTIAPIIIGLVVIYGVYSYETEQNSKALRSGPIDDNGALVHVQQPDASERAAESWSQVTLGMTRVEVRSILGAPSFKTHNVIADGFGGHQSYDDWDYGALGETTYSVSFTGGVVDGKSTVG